MMTDELFNDEDIIPWKAEWQNMPEFNNLDLSPQFQIVLNFACAADVEDVARLIGEWHDASSNGEIAA